MIVYNYINRNITKKKAGPLKRTGIKSDSYDNSSTLTPISASLPTRFS